MASIHSILTEEEKDFIKEHHLDESDFYDARNDSSVHVYHDKAKQKGCRFVIYRESICGHRLKTRNGHCIICKPSRIAFQKRETISGILYLTTTGDYCKIGVLDYCVESLIEDSLRHREYQLNSEGGYAGLTGWKMYKYWKIDYNVGKIEREAHTLLGKYQTTGIYIYSGEIREGKEVFKCSTQTAVRAINKVLKGY